MVIVDSSMDAGIDEITDALGKYVDPGIKESVVRLNEAGFITTQSCEGHIDRVYPAPYIDILETEDLSRLKKLASKFNQERGLSGPLAIKIHKGYMYSSERSSSIARISTLSEEYLDRRPSSFRTSSLFGMPLQEYLQRSQDVVEDFTSYISMEGF